MNAHSSHDPPAGRSPVSGAPSPAETGDGVRPGLPRFGFPLPFDPVRLAGGVLSRWPWILAGMVVCGMAGGSLGVLLTHRSYALSVALIKRRVPHTVQASEAGQAYRPTDLNDATLLATLLATEPMDSAVKRAANGIEPDRIRSLVEAKQLEGTDIFYATYHSPVGEDDAVAFCGIWAEEINAYTQRLQQAEARGVLGILKKEVVELDKELAGINREILDFSKDKDYLGGDIQVSAALAKLSQIELDLQTARTIEKSKKEHLDFLTKQIRKQGPLEMQLRTAKDELAALRASYTDANPLVQAKLQSIEYLSQQIAKLGTQDGEDLDSYTGTPLGNELYLSIITRRSELSEATNRIAVLEGLHTAALERIGRFPAIISAYDALQKKRESIRGGLSLMSDRLREAEIFASGAPGYWQVFQPPDHRAIVPSSMLARPLALGLLGAVAGGCAMVGLTLLLTHRTSRRSVLECCAATGAPLAAVIPADDSDAASKSALNLWAAVLSPGADGGVLVLTAGMSPEEERTLWVLLSAAAKLDSGDSLRVIDLTKDALWDGVDIPGGIEWRFSAGADSVPCASPGAVLCRASALPDGGVRHTLAGIVAWYAAVAGTRDGVREARRLRDPVEIYLPSCSGTIAWMEPPAGLVRRAADWISVFLAKRLSKSAMP